jgi:hypothetical protein
MKDIRNGQIYQALIKVELKTVQTIIIHDLIYDAYTTTVA